MTDYTKHRFYVLDGMRGIAAIIVMLYHFYLDMHLRYFKNSFVAVDFFFVLSGFVLCHAYGNKLLNGMSVGEFLARRIGRLYPLFALGVLMGVPFLWPTADAAQ